MKPCLQPGLRLCLVLRKFLAAVNVTVLVVFRFFFFDLHFRRLVFFVLRLHHFRHQRYR